MRRLGVASCLLGVLASCAAKPLGPAPLEPNAGKPASLPEARVSAPSLRPRLFPPTRGAGVNEAGQERDGSRRLLGFGLRVVEHLDGSLDVGDEVLPAARSARYLELPERLGGGFLFWIVSSNSTLLYRASGWTARLEPFAQLDFEVERFVPGFDRLLILARHDADYRALDLESGRAAPPIGLPPAPAYGQIAFVDDWFAAVQVPLRGVLLSFDAGGTWHPLSLPITSFEPAQGSLALATATGDYRLSPRGALSHVADRDQARVAEAARAELARVVSAHGTLPDRGQGSLLQTAVLRGYPDGRGAALVATEGSLLRVSLDSGKVVERREHAYADGGECQGVRFGSGVAFVCGQDRELTRIYRWIEPLSLELLREFPGARVVSDSASGGLVVHGGCSGTSQRLHPCVL